MKHINLLNSLVLSVMIVMAGCQKNEKPYRTGKAIRVDVSAVDTRSASVTTADLRTAHQFVLDAYVADDYEVADGDGEITTVPGGQYIASGGQYNVFYSATGHEYVRDEDSCRTDGWYIYDTKGYEAYDWLLGNKTSFWCRYPSDAELSTSAKGIRTITSSPTKDGVIMTFSYVMPDASASEPYNDATNQTDMLFAYAQRTFDGTSNLVDINFNHPLSKICFCVSPDDGSFDVTLTIKDISISGMPKSGNCVFTGTGLISKDPACDTPMFKWSDQSGSETYTQTYDVSFAGSGAPAGWNDNNRYKPQSDSKDYNVYYAPDDTDKEHPFRKYTCENAFMMIPHTLNGAVMTVTFGNTGTGDDITVSVNLPEDTGYPGYYYCYKISATTIGRTISMAISLVDWDNYDDKLFF